MGTIGGFGDNWLNMQNMFLSLNMIKLNIWSIIISDQFILRTIFQILSLITFSNQIEIGKKLFGSSYDWIKFKFDK